MQKVIATKDPDDISNSANVQEHILGRIQEETSQNSLGRQTRWQMLLATSIYFEHDFQHNTPGFREIMLQIDSKFLRNIDPLSLLVR